MVRVSCPSSQELATKQGIVGGLTGRVMGLLAWYELHQLGSHLSSGNVSYRESETSQSGSVCLQLHDLTLHGRYHP